MYLNLACHETLGVSPHQIMFNEPPPRQITEIINFPGIPSEGVDLTKIYNRILHKLELKKRRRDKKGTPEIQFEVGEKILIKNRQQPSGAEGIMKKLLLLYNGPFLVDRNNQDNIYVIVDPNTKRVKGTYNLPELKRYYE